MTITDLIVSDTLPRSFAAELKVRVTRWGSSRTYFIGFVLAVIAIVLTIADPRLPDALAASAAEFRRTAMHRV